MKTLTDVALALKRRGYDAHVMDADVAREFVLAAVSSAENVGWGGSETVKELGLREAIAATGKEIRDHRSDCDLFLLSANALTDDGRIVNIDGTGNRVAASIWGPKRVIYLIGRNKLVEGGIDAAVRRVKEYACPPNCRRLGKKTPCALTGHCPALDEAEGVGAGCDSPDRICKVTAVFERPPTRTPTSVILIDANLGY